MYLCLTELFEIKLFLHLTLCIAPSTGAVEYNYSLYSGVRQPNECPRYNTKQSDGETPVNLEPWGMWSTP